MRVPPLRPVAPCGTRLFQAACCTHSRSRTSFTWAETTRGRRGFLPGLARTGAARSFKAGDLAIPAAADSNRPRRASPLGGRLEPAWIPRVIGVRARRWRTAGDTAAAGPVETPAFPPATGGLHGAFGRSRCCRRFAFHQFRAMPARGTRAPGRDPIDRAAGADEPRENDRHALERQEGVAFQPFRSWDANGARWTGNEVAKPFRARTRTVADVRPCCTVEGFEQLAGFRGRRSSSTEESLAWPRIRDERTREAHRDPQI